MDQAKSRPLTGNAQSYVRRIVDRRQKVSERSAAILPNGDVHIPVEGGVARDGLAELGDVLSAVVVARPRRGAVVEGALELGGRDEYPVGYRHFVNGHLTDIPND